MYNQLLLFSLFERFFLLVIFKINNCVSHRPATISSSHSIRKTPYPPSLSHSHPFADKRGRDKRGLWDVSIHGETPRPFFLDAICTYMLYKTSSIKIFFCCVIEIACDTCQIIGLYNWNLYNQRSNNTYYYDHHQNQNHHHFHFFWCLYCQCCPSSIIETVFKTEGPLSSTIVLKSPHSCFFSIVFKTFLLGSVLKSHRMCFPPTWLKCWEERMWTISSLDAAVDHACSSPSKYEYHVWMLTLRQ